MAIDIEGRIGRRVAEPGLNGLDVGALAYEKRRLGVPQHMRAHPLITCPPLSLDAIAGKFARDVPPPPEAVVDAEIAEPSRVVMPVHIAGTTARCAPPAASTPML